MKSVRPACKGRVAALPVLTYGEVRVPPVLAPRAFGLGLTDFHGNLFED